MDLALLVLRFGLAIAFFFTSYYIFTSKDHWTGMILPRAEKFIVGSKESTMKFVAVYDLFQGLWLISGFFPWLAGIFVIGHMLQVLFASGINNVTYRDIAILFAGLSLTIATWPF